MHLFCNNYCGVCRVVVFLILTAVCVHMLHMPAFLQYINPHIPFLQQMFHLTLEALKV